MWRKRNITRSTALALAARNAHSSPACWNSTMPRTTPARKGPATTTSIEMMLAAGHWKGETLGGTCHAYPRQAGGWYMSRHMQRRAAPPLPAVDERIGNPG